MSKTTYCYIGNTVDVGPNGLNILEDIEVEPVRAGYVGQGRLRLRRTSLFTATTFLPLTEVRCWTEDPAAGPAGLTERRFGGVVGRRITRTNSVRNLKRYELPLLDYNFLGKRLVGYANEVNTIVVTIAKLQTQVLAMVTALLAQGGTPSRVLDTTNVADLTPGTALPYAAFRGKSLATMLDTLCANYATATGATAGWHLGPDRSVGGTGLANFGNPCLFLYATGVTPTPSYKYSDTAGGAYLPIYGPWWERELDALDVVAWQQATFGNAGGVVTGAVAASAATYPNPFAGDGYWKAEPIKLDTTDTTTAQAAIDRAVAATAYPVERVTHDVTEDVQVGQYIGETMATEGLADYVMQVGEVKRAPARTDTPELNRRTITLGPPVLELGDGASGAVVAAPQVGDPAPPLAPAQPTILSNEYAGDGTSTVVITLTHSTSLNRAAHYVRHRVNGLLYQWSPRLPETDPLSTSETYIIRNLLPGAALEIWTQAVSGAGVWSAFSPVRTATIHRRVIPLPLPVPGGDDLDPDALTAAFSRDYTAAATGSGTAPTRDLGTVFESLSTWALAVGSSAGSATVTSEVRKAAGPGTVLTIRWREGNAGAAQGTLSVLVQPRDKSDATVGSAITAYSAAPSTVSTGTLREVQVTLPATTTITQVSWSIGYTGDGTHARTVSVTPPQIGPSLARADIKDNAVGPAQAQLGTDVLLNGSMEIPDQPGLLPAGWTSSGTVAYGNALSIGAGDGQYACQLGVATGTHTLTSGLVQWTRGKNYSGRIRWMEYLSVVGAALVITVTVRCYNAAGTYISSLSVTPETSNSAGAWLGNAGTWDGNTLPATTAFIAIQFQAVTTSGTPYYGVDGLELVAVNRLGIASWIEHRRGDGGLVGKTVVNGTASLDIYLYDAAAWWKLLAGAGIDLGGAASGGTVKTAKVSTDSGNLSLVPAGGTTAVTGAVTATGNLTVGSGTSSGTVQNTGSGGSGELALVMSGDEYGGCEAHLLNRSGNNGPLFYANFTDHAIRLIDFIFKWNTPSGTDQRNIRVEDRAAYVFSGANPEFQFGTHDDPDFCTSAGGARVRRGILTLASHLVSGGSAPGIAGGTGAGSGIGLAVALAGNDLAGKITITTGTTAPTLNGVIATITFATAFGATPVAVLLTPGNANAAAHNIRYYVDAASTSTTLWKLTNQGTALGTSAQYIWYYTVIG